MRRTALWLGLLLALSAPAWAGQRAGTPAADFTLPDLGGAKVQLAAQKGKIVVVDFWASWCEPCLRELPELERLARELQQKGVVVLAIGLDKERESTGSTARRLGLRAVQVLLDVQGSVAERYDPPKMPTSYVLDRGGAVRFVHAGFEGAGDVARLRRELLELIRQGP